MVAAQYINFQELENCNGRWYDWGFKWHNSIWSIIRKWNNLVGLNLIGLRRAKFSNMIKYYKILRFNFSNQNFRSNIDNLYADLKDNKYVKIIIDFINSDKKRPISLPQNIKWLAYFGEKNYH